MRRFEKALFRNLSNFIFFLQKIILWEQKVNVLYSFPYFNFRFFKFILNIKDKNLSSRGDYSLIINFILRVNQIHT